VTTRSSHLIETGLRAIDLFAPVSYDTDVLLTGQPHSGIKILANELAYRLAKQTVHVAIYVDSSMIESDKAWQELQEYSQVLKHTYICSDISHRDIQSHRQAPESSAHDAIFAVASSPRFIDTFRQAIRTERQLSTSNRTLTTFLVAENFPKEGYTDCLFSSQVIAKEAIYPALDPRHSTSSGLARITDSRRRRLAEQARLAVSEVIENLYEGAINDPNWFFNSDPRGRLAVQLFCYLSQPYFVAEPYTGNPAKFVSQVECLASLDTILSGRLVDLPAKNFRFRNELPS
jgi:F-type H+/Na+-transporting ATPase subunit beta